MIRQLSNAILAPFGVVRRALSRLTGDRGGMMLVGTAVAVGLVVALSLPAAVYAWSLLFSRLTDHDVQRRLIYSDQRSMAAEVYDRDDRYLGVIHHRADPQDDYIEPDQLQPSDPDLRRDIREYDIRPDHRTVHVTPAEVPEVFWRCATYIEDRNAGGLTNPAGIDVTTPLRVVVSHRGASTIPMMLSRYMRLQPPSGQDSPATTVTRKFTEMWEAPATWRMLARGHDRGPLRAWSAEHVPLVTNLGSGGASDSADGFGLRTSARLLFGRLPQDLSPAQQIALAGAYYWPLVPSEPERSSTYNRRVRHRWIRIVDRAEAICLSPAARIVASTELARIRKDLDDLRRSPPSIRIDAAVMAAMARQATAEGRELRPVALEHPYALLRRAMPSPERRLVSDILLEHYGRNWRDQVRGVRLTVDTPSNLAFQTAMSRAWADFRSANADGWLLAEDRRGKMGFLAVAADSRGRIVRFYEGGMPTDLGRGRVQPSYDDGSAQYFGRLLVKASEAPPMTRLCKAGRSDGIQWLSDACPYDSAPGPLPHQGREIASVGKIVAAIALGQAGARPTPELTRAFALSETDEIERALEVVPEQRLRSILKAFGFKATAGTPLRRAISSGQINGTPRDVQRLAAAALAIASDDFTHPVSLPTIIRQFDLYDTAKLTARSDLVADDPDGQVDLRRLLALREGPSEADMAQFVRVSLAAPICDSGTLAVLADWCPGRRPSVRILVGKTGTRATGRSGQGATVDIWITGGVQFEDGRSYTYVVLAGTGEPRSPFHTGALNANRAAPIVDLLLRDLERSGRGRSFETTHNIKRAYGGRNGPFSPFH